ncbi:MAG: M48 family metalloprotease [Acidimicrobiales bacterium]|nr:M48 family metalloprotease [Acidimicrobiales bacterium]
MTPKQRAARMTVASSLIPAVIAALVVLFAAGWLAAVIALVVIGAGLAGGLRLTADRRVAARIGGSPADPKRDARLCNLVEGLSTGAGVRQPHLRVVESSGLNALAAGTNPSKAVLAVTSGLLEQLDRIELEAVLAEQLYLIRHGETLPGTVLAAAYGIGRPLALAADADAGADQGAISLTRYPPALASALEKIESQGAEVVGQPTYMSHLWMVDPQPSSSGSSGSSGRGRLALRERVEALREL